MTMELSNGLALTYPYPEVMDEQATIDKCLEGYSLARFGDGELKIIYGAGYVREPPNPWLSSELQTAMLRPSKRCLVGVPTMDPKGPKYDNWMRHRPRFSRLFEMVLPSAQLYSAFITRPDSSPWIRTEHFAKSVERLWLGKHAVVICEKHGSIYKTVQLRAGKVTHITCPRQRAYAEIDRLAWAVLGAKPDIAIISAGPTATCLANRLSEQGVQAIDLGSSGRWLGTLLGVVSKPKKELTT